MRATRSSSAAFERRSARGSSRIGAVAALLAVLLCAATATAQLPPPRRTTEFSAELGWNGRIMMGAWTPLRINVSGGTEAVSGVITAHVECNDTVAGRAQAPFVSTPGATVSVDLALPVPFGRAYAWQQDAIRIEVGAFSESGRRLFETALSTSVAQGVPSIFPPLSASAKAVLNVGSASLDAANSVWTQQRPPRDPAQWSNSHEWSPWHNVHVLPLAPSQLSSLRGAYESAAAIVLAGAEIDRVPDGAALAIREWTRSGGRLVLIPGRPGRDLRGWIPAGWIGVEGIAPEDGSEMRVALTVSPDAGRVGWTVRAMARSADAPRPAGRDIAEGPVGLGWVTVLAAEPGLLAEEAQPEHAWQDILRTPLADHLSQQRQEGYWGPWNEDQPERTRFDPALNWIAERVDSAGAGPLVLLGLLVGVLGLLVGPVDRIVLKRRRWLQHSWATAIGWIGVVTAAAYLIPRTIRTGGTSQGRVAVIDAVASNAPAPEPVAFEEGVSGIVAGQPGFREIGGAKPHSWWRAVSAGEGSFDSSSLIIDPLTTLVTPTDRGGAALANRVLARVWALQTYEDEAPVDPGMRATAYAPAPHLGSWTIHLEAQLPAGATVHPEAALHTADGVFALHLDPSREGNWTCSTLTRPSPDVAERWAWSPQKPRAQYAAYGYSADLRTPAGFFHLPGAARRSGAMQAAIATRRWAVVTFIVEGGEPGVRFGESGASTVARIYRLLVPVEPPEGGNS